MLKKIGIFICFLTAITAAHAQTITPRYVIAPTCLLQSETLKYHILATSNKMSLIKINEDSVYALSEKNSKMKFCRGFKDVTIAWQHKKDNVTSQQFLTKSLINNVPHTNFFATTNEYKIRYPQQVNQLISTINPSNIWTKLTSLTAFPDRYAGDNFAGSANGVKAANWIESELEKMVSASQRNDTTIFTIETEYLHKPGEFLKQPSVVIKIGNGTEAGIVLGAHMDTLSSKYELKPGADDDGSGSAAMLETARVLISSGMKFKRPIYLIWYAAEELGLLGSQSVVSEFEKQNIPVAQVLQFDCLGYAYQNDLTMWLLNDPQDTDSNLTQFIEKLITNYVKRPVKYTACGYSCSDHASWMQRGISAASLLETSFETRNQDWHTAKDTMEKLTLDHMTDFTKLAVAAAIELAEPGN